MVERGVHQWKTTYSTATSDQSPRVMTHNSSKQDMDMDVY